MQLYLVVQIQNHSAVGCSFPLSPRSGTRNLALLFALFTSFFFPAHGHIWNGPGGPSDCFSLSKSAQMHTPSLSSFVISSLRTHWPPSPPLCTLWSAASIAKLLSEDRSLARAPSPVFPCLPTQKLRCLQAQAQHPRIPSRLQALFGDPPGQPRARPLGPVVQNKPHRRLHEDRDLEQHHGQETVSATRAATPPRPRETALVKGGGSVRPACL